MPDLNAGKYLLLYILTGFSSSQLVYFEPAWNVSFVHNLCSSGRFRNAEVRSFRIPLKVHVKKFLTSYKNNRSQKEKNKTHTVAYIYAFNI